MGRDATIRLMKPERILFLAEAQLGDLLVLTPAIRAVKETFPESFVGALVLRRRTYSGNERPALMTRNPETGPASVLTRSPHVDALWELDREGLRALKGPARLRTEVSIAGRIRGGGFDTVICTFPEDRFAVWALLSGARRRVGQRDQGLSRALNRRVDVRKEDDGVLRYYGKLVEAIGAVMTSEKTEFPVGEDDRDWAAARFAEIGLDDGSPVVAVHPGATTPGRIWPPDRYARMTEALASEGATVVLLGTDFDDPVLAAIRKELEREVPEIRFDERVSRLAAVLERCTLCVSNDSGPRHLAIAVGTPSIAFLSRVHDRQWRIYDDPAASEVLQSASACPVCSADECRDLVPEGEERGSACIRGVGVDVALAAVRRRLSAIRV